MESLHYASIERVAAALASGELSALELTDALLARIDEFDPQLRAYATLTAEAARAAALEADRERAAGLACGPLHGIPLGLKDIIAAAGVATHAGSIALRNWQPGSESTVAARLRRAGAVLLGKHQTTEGACGAHHPSVTPPLNPWRASAWTGVSSSGSGVAVAAGLSYASFGSDTGGSIRFPSHCCGLVGLKATYGRVSRYGVVPLAPSLDHVGPMARSVSDVAALYAAVAGYDPLDPDTLDAPVAPWHATPGELRALRVGVDESLLTDGIETTLSAALHRAVEQLREAGARIVAVRVPRLDETVSDWLTLCATEALAAHHSTWPARAAEYGPALSALLKYAGKIDADQHALAASNARTWCLRYQAVFDNVDLFVSPTFHGLTPSVAQATREMRGDGLRRFVAFTAAANLCGNPTLSLPAGCASDGVPFGYQLVGARLGEHALFSAGDAIEKTSRWSWPELGD